MFKSMKLPSKLVIAFLVVGVVPFAVVSVYSLMKSTSALSGASYNQLIGLREFKKNQVETFFAARQGDMGVLIDTVGTLRQEAMAKLGAARQVKKAAVERYFQDIGNQILTFSEDSMVVTPWTACGAWPPTWPRIRRKPPGTRAELAGYYKDHFAVEYAKQNSAEAGRDRHLGGLDDQAVQWTSGRAVRSGSSQNPNFWKRYLNDR